LSTGTTVPIITAEISEPESPILREGDNTPVHQEFIEPTPVRLIEHTIQSGETLVSIAEQYGITADAISAVNFMAEPDLLMPDQVILIPLDPQPTPAPEALRATIAAALENAGPKPVTLGYSVLDRPIELYTFGVGSNSLIFIGGIHGGYEWNSTVLAYEFIDYFTENPTAVPEAVTLHIIPAANPDGIFAVTGKSGPITAEDVVVADTFPARFNSNGVDLNRNWGCDWAASAVWWDEIVSGGFSPYSEIENKILLTFIESQEERLQGVIFWHSSAFLVSPGQCGDEAHQPSLDIASVYARAARYPTGSFDTYPITGEASDSLAEMGIPSFSVELSSHEAIDWIRNLDGMEALLALFS
jgi:LysM repeat protein